MITERSCMSCYHGIPISPMSVWGTPTYYKDIPNVIDIDWTILIIIESFYNIS